MIKTTDDILKWCSSEGGQFYSQFKLFIDSQILWVNSRLTHPVHYHGLIQTEMLRISWHPF